MIHSSAIISPEAEIAPDVEIGPYAIIEGPVKIASGCRILAHAQVLGDTEVGENCFIGRGAIIGEQPQDLTFKASTPSGVRIASNNVIREYVTIHRGSKEGSCTRMGEGNYLMANAHLAHDVVLGKCNILANAVLIAGHVRVGDHTFMGGSSVFHQFLRVGSYCVIQGNSAFSKDVPHYCSGALLNRITGLNVIGMRRQGFTREDRAAIKAMFALFYRRGLNFRQAVEAAHQQEWPECALAFLRFFEEPSKKGVSGARAAHDGEDEAV